MLKKIILTLLTVFLLIGVAAADTTVYWRQALTGGTATALDAVSENTVNDGDLSVTVDNNKFYVLRYDVDSAAAEDSPHVITPDDSTGSGRWLEQSNPQDVSNYAKRNRWINSEGMIDQRNEGTAITTPGWVVDRHVITWSNTDELVVSAQQQTTGLLGDRNSYRFTASTAETAIIADEIVAPLSYKFLGYDVADLAGEEVTVSFNFQSNAPDGSIFSLALVAGDNSYSYVTDFTYTTSEAAQHISKTITIDASNAITDTTDGIGLRVYIAAIGGANFQASGTDAWVAKGTSASLCSSSRTEWTNTNGRYVQFSGMQLRFGADDVPLPRKSRSEYLAECGKYFLKSYNQGTAIGTVTGAGAIWEYPTRNHATYLPGVRFATTMIGTPSVTIYSPGGATPDRALNQTTRTVLGTLNRGMNGFSGVEIATGTTSFESAYHYTADAEL